MKRSLFLSLMLLGASWVNGQTAPEPLPRTYETPILGADIVVVEAIVPAPGLEAREAAAWRVLGEALLEGTQEYTKLQLLTYGSQAGIAPRVTVLPDHMRIEFAMPKGGLDVAVGLLESMLRRPSLPAEEVVSIASEMARRRKSVWQEALDPYSPDYSAVKPGDVRELARRAIQPDRVIISIAGAFPVGEGVKQIQSAFSDWKPTKASTPRSDKTLLPLLARKSEVTTVEWRAPAVAPSDGSYAATILAVFALGVGKEGAMTRILRTANSWSYRQEAVLWPTGKGWQPRFIVAMKLPEEDVEVGERVRKALLEDIATWTEDHRVRALAMAEAALTRRLEVSPFWGGPAGPVALDVADRAFWTGYGALIGSPGFGPSETLEAVRTISLDDLKARAKALLETAAPAIILGRPG